MTAAGDTTVSWADLSNVTATTQQASSGSPTTGGRYNWGNSGDTTDRALGVMTSGSYAEPNSILAAFTNNTGSTITSFTFGFDLERYRRNTAGLTNNFYFSTDGSSWGSAVDTFAWGTGASAYDFTPTVGEGSVSARSGSVGSLSLATSSTFYLRWEFDASASGNSQGVGLDNFSLTATLAASGIPNYWDTNGATAGIGGSGTWSTASTSFSTAVAGDVATVVRADSDAVIFGGTAGTVTVDGIVNANNGITFGTTGYEVTGGTAVNLGGSSGAQTTFTVDSAVTATIVTDVTGSNGMTKTGSGTLVFTGDKTYTGGTTISGGTLQLGDGTTNGSVTGNITNNGNLAVNNGPDQTVSNDISGTGALTKSGAGNLTLSGTNDYIGGTTVSAGELTGTTSSLQGAITNNAAVTFDQGTNGTYAGAMTGSGSLTKEGVGIVTLSGTNSYSGGTTVVEGGLIGTTSSLQGAITNNTLVTLDQSTSGTYAGAMTGSGSLIKDGTGNVTVSGANDYSGGTTVSGGTLTGTTTSLQGDITNNAAVAFNQATDGTYSGVMSGAGSLAKSGTGEVTLTGNNSFLGGTTVSGGELVAGHNSALGTGTATVTNGSLFASSGVTVANDIVVNATTGGSLLITQYYEGTATNKWIEITNIGGSSIDLAAGDFRVGHYNNANAEGYKTDVAPSFTLSLTGTLTAGQSLLLGNTGNTTPPYALGHAPQIDDNSVINFNGNDSIVLYTGSTFASSNIVDAIGFTNTGNEGIDTSFVRASTASGFNLTAGSNVDNFSPPWSEVALPTVDGASASTDNYLGYSSLTGGGSGSATLGSNITSGTATFTGGVTLSSDVILTAAAGGTSAFNGVITGSVGNDISKNGAGEVILAGTNTYTGATTVNEGTLIINGDQSAATGNVTVASGATLGGTGIIGGDTSIDGTLSTGTAVAPGTVGAMTFAGAGTDVAFNTGSVWLVDIVQGLSPSNDAITVGGNLNITGTSNLTFNLTGDYTLTQSYTIANYTGTRSGFFSNYNASGTYMIGGFDYYLDYGTGTNSAITLTAVAVAVAVPEPGTLTLLGLGLGGLIARRIRKRKDAQAA